jgi:pimeloyl-ACP methyl ester carboxylesterase
LIAPTEQRIELPHGTLTAQLWGDAHAPPLLALHGWLDNAGSFARLAPLLTTRFRVIALDLPGHGHSDHAHAAASYPYIDQVQAVLATADVLHLDRYVLLGHSLGAGIASLAAVATPERIAHLLLIEGLGPLGDDGSHTLQRFRDAFAARIEKSRPLRVFRSIEQAVSARTMVSGLPAELAQPIVERGLKRVDDGWQWSSDPRLTRPSATRLAESQIHSLLRGISSPTSLLLAQPTTPYLPDALMKARADCVGNIVVSHMDGGHHLHLEHPQAAHAWIEASLSAGER